ncbi:MAG: hypothetical protein LLG97_12350 [Deltaproteobacteria bacterium]|nr:hypothetical protein [Deltaproteobacteria bacterium]
MNREFVEVMNDLRSEREKQDAKWGSQNHGDSMWLTVLMEEIGEACAAGLQMRSDAEIEQELIQAAAVLVAWLECKKRRRIPG